MPTAARAAGELAPVSEKLAPDAVARAAGRRRARIPRRAGRRRQGRAQPPADPDRRRARHRQGNGRPRDPRRQPARPRPAGHRRLQGGPRQHHRQRAVRPREGRLPRRLRRTRSAGWSRPTAARLLLDEIGALAAETQETLDRVLATGEVRPVGCNGSNSVDVRLIATSAAGRCPTISTRRSPSGSARPPSPCRRCASAAATFRRSPATCSAASPSRPACGRCRSATTRWRC